MLLKIYGGSPATLRLNGHWPKRKCVSAGTLRRTPEPYNESEITRFTRRRRQPLSFGLTLLNRLGHWNYQLISRVLFTVRKPDVAFDLRSCTHPKLPLTVTQLSHRLKSRG